MVSPPLVPMERMEPTSSISSGVGTDSFRVYVSSLSSSVARMLGSSGPKVDISSGTNRDDDDSSRVAVAAPLFCISPRGWNILFLVVDLMVLPPEKARHRHGGEVSRRHNMTSSDVCCCLNVVSMSVGILC